MSEIHIRILNKLKDYPNEIQEYVESAFRLAATLPEVALAEELKAEVRKILKEKEIE